MKKKPAKQPKRAKKSKTASLPASPPPVLATCEVCGETYHVGAPHSAFCRGTKETKCAHCGGEMSDDVSVAACRECGAVFCSECGNADDCLCPDCEGR